MAEWFKAAVLKTAFRATGTGVRIPLPPYLYEDAFVFLAPLFRRGVGGWKIADQES
jgi:hypothetical protein